MNLVINGNDYFVPFDPNIISLGDYIEYFEQYGRALDEKILSVWEDEDLTDEEKELRLDNICDEEAISWFSFWTKVPLVNAKNLPDINPVLSRYRLFRYILKSSEEECTLPFRVRWEADDWEIQDFKVNPASKMSFNEIVTSKDATEQIIKLKLGKWRSVHYLSAIFFRKVGEPFVDEMIHEDSDRLKLMLKLPMSYAVNVAFFLSVCVSFWNQISVSSNEQEAEIQNRS